MFWEDPYRFRSPDNIIQEIQRNIDIYGANYFNFWDDLSFASVPQAERFVDRILESGLKFKWSASVRVDLLGNPKVDESRRRRLAEKMKDAGCSALGFSLESGSKEILEMMNKKIEPEYFTEQVSILKDVGIVSNTTVVFGYPLETKDSIKQTFDMCLESSVYPSIGYLLPLPSTGMYQHALDNGFITDQDKY